METLNEPATRLLFTFIDFLDHREKAFLHLPEHPTIQVTKEPSLKTDDGPGFVFGIGALLDTVPPKYEMYMKFLVIDRRKYPKLRPTTIAYVLEYRDDYNEVVSTTAHFEGSEVVVDNLLLQKFLSRFAHSWLIEIDIAGYLQTK